MIENAAFLIGPWWGSWVCPMNMKIHFTSAVQVPVASRVTLQLKFQRCYLFSGEGAVAMSADAVAPRLPNRMPQV